MSEKPQTAGSSEDNELPSASSTKADEFRELRQKPHLEVYDRYSILVVKGDAVDSLWAEGRQSVEAQQRYQQVISAFKTDFLDDVIQDAKSPSAGSIFESKIHPDHKAAIERIAGSITAQSGRALVDVLVLQLAVKAICPDQDVRLHKSNPLGSSFSWEQGVSMRTLDQSFVVPTLRKYDLLRMNRFGAFMTRTFAENYPYSPFYKAEIAGAKARWLWVVEELEAGRLDAYASLLYLLHLLWRSSEAFTKLVEQMLSKLHMWISEPSHRSLSAVVSGIKTHIEKSDDHARLLEVAMHSLLQALEDSNVDLSGTLKPLMPMRTANLKHGNVGDIELLVGDLVVEAWDAKYDQPYLADALDELVAKIHGIDTTQLTFGYVMFPEKKDYAEVDKKVADLLVEFGLSVQILSFDEWVSIQASHGLSTEESEAMIAAAWFRAYAESLALRRRDRAPIDEPTFEWVQSLDALLE